MTDPLHWLGAGREDRSTVELPWRGPGPDRPNLPLPPARMPLRQGGRWRKRWRYVGVFCEEFLLCAARIGVGPLHQTFWAIVDRETGEMWERTKMLLPGARGEVWTELPAGETVVEEFGDEGVLSYVPDEGSLSRIDVSDRDLGHVRAFLHYGGGGKWVEAVCPTEEDRYVWTRKRADVPVECDVRIAGRRWRVEARGVEDETAGYHPRHTVWTWSAGVGTTTSGSSVGWNLVAGINDPPARSERAIWIDGEPTEPGPVGFEGLGAIVFDDGARLAFEAEAERRKEENRFLVSYSYVQPFGRFSGTLPGGIELASGLGVMEHHDATW
jgi:uncharacterized protein DUF2804